MKQYFSSSAKVLLAFVICLTVFLFLTRSRPVLLRISPDSTIRPRYYCLLNPFRDVAPEELAEKYLTRLRDGAVAEIAPFIGQHQYILEAEKEHPIQRWRISNREDTSDKTRIMYWVTRGNGYSKDGYEEEVLFQITRTASGWKVESFSAIY